MILMNKRNPCFFINIKKKISCSTKSRGPFEGDTVTSSKEGNNTPTFQETILEGHENQCKQH
jgi:hypothetical protein